MRFEGSPDFKQKEEVPFELGTLLNFIKGYQTVSEEPSHVIRTGGVIEVALFSNEKGEPFKDVFNGLASALVKDGTVEKVDGRSIDLILREPVDGVKTIKVVFSRSFPEPK